VVAFGRIIGPLELKRGDSGAILCFELIFAGPFPGCPTTASVRLLNLDPTTLPGRLRPDRPGGTWVSDYAEVHGTWDGAGIDVIEARPEPDDPFPPAPCEPPINGWPGNGANWEAERSRLGDYIVARPQDYAEYWFASTGADPMDADDHVFVANTVLDVVDVESVLEEMLTATCAS
jgi:hypothetical protein